MASFEGRSAQIRALMRRKAVFMRFAAAILALALSAPQTPIGPQQCQSCLKPKPVYKVTKLSLTDVGVTCLNGADPTGQKYGNVLIISCDTK